MSDLKKNRYRMLSRFLPFVTMLAVPMMMFALGPGRSRSAIHPDIPDTLKGVNIRLEARETRIIYQGRTVFIRCLCSEITNQNEWPEKILVKYLCRGQPREKEVNPGGGSISPERGSASSE